ncbi:MAG TPA: DedA family protein [Rhodobacterales bacterium]|nr:DedA family protein [Rhodobacterales bacterium]
MITLDQAMQLMQSHGLWLLAPIAIIEGPIITVIAGYLAHLGAFSLGAAYVIVVLADLVGDALFYLFGRNGLGWLSPRWRNRLGLTEDRLAGLAEHFDAKGGRTLILGKLTHTLGALALIAAGMAHMRFVPFLWYNLVATLPKSLFFLALGYGLGAAYKQVDAYIFWFSLVPLVAVALWALRRYFKRREARK